MSMKHYFKSINDEFMALQNRLKYLIGHTHHLTIGNYQESLLIDFLSKYLPDNIGVSRGFVLFNQRDELDYGNRRNNLDYNSNEIDILLYDKTRPTLYKSNDLVIVDVNSVKGMIEVKGNLTTNILDETISKFKTNIEKINLLNDNKCIFSGVFAYKTSNFSEQSILKKLNNDSLNINRVINHVCLGNLKFIKFWDNNPNDLDDEDYNTWHYYKFKESLAMGYFIYNLITYFNETNDSIWFPSDTKENYQTHSRLLS